MTKIPTKAERLILADEAEVRSLETGELLRERGLCPLVLVRTYGAGVHVGLLARLDGQVCELLDSRRLWRWQGANSLSEAARKGVSKGYTRLSEPVPHAYLPTTIEVFAVSADAAESLTTSRWAS